MIEGPRVLVPLDGSALTAWALDRAFGLLSRPGAVVTLLGVVEAPEALAADLAFRVDPRHAPFHDALAAERDRLAARGVFAQAEIRFGDPADALLREIREGGHDLVAMTARGRRFVPRGSSVPLLLFRPLLDSDGALSPAESRGPAPLRRIFVAVDGSEDLAGAVDLARWMDGEIRLFADQEDRLERISGLGVRTSIAVGGNALAAALSWGADVVTMPSDARLPRLAARSRAEDVEAGVEAGPVVRVT